MCLLALFFRVVEDSPLVAGANREEAYERGGEPPRILEGPIRAVSGLDPSAGGTWFGVNEHGLVAAVTNRRRSPLPEEPRSRGLLTRDLLDCSSVKQATLKAVDELQSGKYAGCNLLLADRDQVTAIHFGAWLQVIPLPVGIHVMTSAGDVNSTADPRIAQAREWLLEREPTSAADCLKTLRKLCAFTGEPPMCLRGPHRGTVSSTLLALACPLSRSTMLHAQGAPDKTPYKEISPLLRDIFPSDL